MTTSVTKPCFTTQHQTCKTKTIVYKTKTTACKTRPRLIFFLSPTGLVLRPRVSDHITGCWFVGGDDFTAFARQSSSCSLAPISECLQEWRHFPGEHGLAGSTGAKNNGDCDDNWSYKTCKAPVKSSPPTYHQLTFYRPDALPVAQPTVSKHWRECCMYSFFTKNQNQHHAKVCMLNS